MKKYLVSLLSFLLLPALAACGSGKKMEEFNTEATIGKTVIYDENNIKITADELAYSAFSADLSVTIENKTDKNLSFVCGSSGYCVNSVNGFMVDCGYMNSDIAAGQSESGVISFDFNSLNTYGITEIADMEIGFSISDDDYNYIYTDPLQIKTSIADEYDYSTNKYQEVVTNGALENRFDCKVNYFSDETLYEKYDICINSACVITNKDGESSLLLETENNSSGDIFAQTEEIYLNNCLVYDSTWTSDRIGAGKKCITEISLNDLSEKYDGEFSDISDISEISFTFGVGEKWYKAEDTKQITVSVPNIKISAEEE